MSGGAAPGRVSARTRVLALLGDPVAHSLSPEVQNAAFRESGVDGVYVAIRCGKDDLPPLMGALARAGGGGNVTLPHKERAAAAVDRPTDAVRRTGACNTFWGDEDGSIHGDNTDVEGFSRAARALLDGPPEDRRILLLGAGGAARAALVALLDDGAREVLIHNRTTERARAVARRIGGERVRVAEAEDVEDAAFDLVVNATRLGLEPDDPLPLDLERLKRVGAVMDLVYGPDGTEFVRTARSLGVKAEDGSRMLVQQAAVAYERWWGREAPLDVMSDALGVPVG